MSYVLFATGSNGTLRPRIINEGAKSALNFGRTFFWVTGASIALAAFVTLDYTFSDVFDVSMKKSLETELGSFIKGPVSDTAVLAVTLLAYVLVMSLGGLLGGLAYRIFRRIPPLSAGNRK